MARISGAISIRRALKNGLLAAAVTLPAAIASVLLGASGASGGYLGATRVRTDDGRLLPAERLGNSDYCGHCHTQIFHEWNASAHHFSSLNNPIYRSVVLSTAARSGPETLQRCAGCHDPLPLAAGEPISGKVTQWSSTAGITCLACHRITEVHGGDGAYTLSAPTLHPFALSDQPWQQKLHGWLLATFPGMHRAVLSKPLYATAEYCAGCHTLTAAHAADGRGNLLLQNEYESWRNSRFAGGADAKSCVDCHMPRVPSQDPAARDGKIRSHRFVGGNTLLPQLNRDHDQLAASEEFLQQGAVVLSCRSIRTSAGEMPCRGARAERRFEVTLELSNVGVGHDFPGGTNDSNQAWVEVEATDSSGRVLYHAGRIGPGGDPDESAYALHAVYADTAGRVLDRRTATTHAATLVSTTVLSPGESRQLHYAIEVDDETRFPITVNARLNWRKFSTAFLRSVFPDAQPQAPLTIVDEVAIELGAP